MPDLIFAFYKSGKSVAFEDPALFYTFHLLYKFL